MPYRTSYWELTTFLRSPDVLIVGAGLTGLQAALALKREAPTLEVLVVERAPLPRGASTRNAGFACFGGPTELLADLDAYGERAVVETVKKRYAGIQALARNFAGRDIDWQQLGGYELVDEAEKIAMVQDRLRGLNRLLREVTGLEETWSVQQDVGPFVGNPLLLQNLLEAQLHPGKLVRLLLREAQTLGVRFLFGTKVEKIVNGTAHLSELGILRPRQILITVNAFARALLPEDFPEDIRPVRNQVLLSRLLPGFTLEGCYHYHEGYVYFRNVGPRRLLIGGARHLTGADSETDQFGDNPVPVAFLLEKLRQWLPQHEWLPEDFTHRWSGIIAQGKGKTPILRYASENVLVAARLAGMGVALSADLATRAAAKLLTGK